MPFSLRVHWAAVNLYAPWLVPMAMARESTPVRLTNSYFVDGNVQNGCICLGIAFLLSPYGLHYLAVKLTARFIGMRMLLKERIYG